MVGVEYGANLVWLNNGSGSFTNTGQALGSASTFGIGLGDFDGDGDLDAFTANNGPADRVWFNDGSGNFTDSTQQLGGFLASQEADAGDVDGDGDIDVVVASNPGSRVWINDGSGVFTTSGTVLNPGTSNEDAKFGDFDADGDLDVWATGWNNDSETWLNDGAGNFSQGQNLTFSGLRRAGWVGLGDVDGDGDLDAFEGNRFSGGARVWINQNLTPNVALSIDNATLDEAAGGATVTATLSQTTTSEVVVSLELSGTATATDDFTISATEIVITPGATTGSVTLTAVEDAVDEPDETVTIDISSVANGNETGTQQVTATILDNDETVVPDVTLAVDNAAIPEAAGVATFTVTLSATTIVPVTVDLTTSGTASASDFTLSANQIVVAPGATTGSVTVTAVQDEDDEPDETVVVEMASVTGGTPVGDLSATTVIQDDDEPSEPNVTLTLNNVSVAEAAATADFTVTLSEATTQPVTVDLTISGTATEGVDFVASGTQITFAPGTTTGTLTITAVQDEVDEPDETVIVDISNVAGGIEVGEQQQTATIIDDDETPASFRVSALTPTDSGFVLTFNGNLDGSEINLYDTQNAAAGAPDVVVTGATSGAVSGSLILTDTTATFIKSGEQLAPDTYTVTLVSGANGFKDDTGAALDGNADGNAGDDYMGEFTIGTPTEGARTIGIPDFVRGPGQDVNLPADGTTGIPVVISEGDNVRAVDMRISYDPNLLEITGATAAPGGTVVVNTATPGLAIFVYFSTTPLPAGESTVINIQATVPTENASANYRSQQVLDIHSVVVGDGNDNEFPVVVDDALHFATYFADVSGNGRINASDAAQVARFAALIDSGFAASLNTDPILVGDISGNGRINAADASRVAQFAALIEVPEIPPVPGGIQITGIVLQPGIAEPDREEASNTDALFLNQADDIGFRVVEQFASVADRQTQEVDSVLEEADDDLQLTSDLEDILADLF